MTEIIDTTHLSDGDDELFGLRFYRDGVASPDDLGEATESIESDELPAEPAELAVADAEATVVEPAAPEKKRSWWRRNQLKLALGAAALSVGLTFMANPAGEVLDKVKGEVPAVGIGMLAAEGAWIAGAGMMLAGAGKKVSKNPLKLKSSMAEITEMAKSGELGATAKDSKLFKAGFAINLAGALAEFAIPAAAVCTKLPVESWGVLSLSTLDLAATALIRYVIVDGIRTNAAKAEATQIEAPQDPTE